MKKILGVFISIVLAVFLASQVDAKSERSPMEFENRATFNSDVTIKGSNEADPNKLFINKNTLFGLEPYFVNDWSQFLSSVSGGAHGPGATYGKSGVSFFNIVPGRFYWFDVSKIFKSAQTALPDWSDGSSTYDSGLTAMVLSGTTKWNGYIFAMGKFDTGATGVFLWSPRESGATIIGNQKIFTMNPITGISSFTTSGDSGVSKQMEFRVYQILHDSSGGTIVPIFENSYDNVH